MKKIENILLTQKATIKEALNVINIGAMKIALIVDSEKKLIGTVCDGDIRRGLLKGYKLDDPVEPIIFRTPTVCKINYLKEDIISLAVEKKIYQIPIVDHDGVLVGIEEVDELLRPIEYDNKVVLMVGGLGTRLSPLTDRIPKPLLEVGEKPILETIIGNFKRCGFKNIILCVNYKSHMIEKHFGDGKDFGVSIEYVQEQKRMGTAGALSRMKDKLLIPFFVMNGDLLTNINFEHMLEFHMENKATATMGVREYDLQVPYGVVNIKGHQVLGIEEKPIHKFFVNGGVYILNSSILNMVPDDAFFDMPTLFERIIGEGNKTISFSIKDYWLDIGQLSDYERANNEYDRFF